MTGHDLGKADKAIVRSAVAEVQESMGLSALAAATRQGQSDQMPMMQAALFATAKVLEARA